MILIGQDNRGAWGWMIVDRHGALVTSGDGLPDRVLATDVAVAVYQGAVTRREADLDPTPFVTFPDEDARS